VRAPVGDINMATERCCIGRGVAAVRHKTGARSFTYYSMGSMEDAFARFEAEGTVFGSIGKKDFHSLASVTATEDIVAAFERVVGVLDDRLRLNEEQSRTLEALRDTLLPKLISGELRVKTKHDLSDRADESNRSVS
jgi:type I restriction enzyme S subunit